MVGNKIRNILEEEIKIKLNVYTEIRQSGEAAP